MRHSSRTRILAAVGIAALLLLLCAATPANGPAGLPDAAVAAFRLP